MLDFHLRDFYNAKSKSVAIVENSSYELSQENSKSSQREQKGIHKTLIQESSLFEIGHVEPATTSSCFSAMYASASRNRHE